MALEEITLGAFALCNSLRVIAYIPQIWKAASDENGASAISYTTWGLFLVAHLSTVGYAIVNRADWGLAACFALNAVCCVIILAVAYRKRRQHVRRARNPFLPSQATRLETHGQWQAGPSPHPVAFFHWD